MLNEALVAPAGIKTDPGIVTEAGALEARVMTTFVGFEPAMAMLPPLLTTPADSERSPGNCIWRDGTEAINVASSSAAKAMSRLVAALWWTSTASKFEPADKVELATVIPLEVRGGSYTAVPTVAMARLVELRGRIIGIRTL